MYIVFGLLSALFASLSIIIIKLSLLKESSTLITFYKTVFIFLITLLLVKEININNRDLIIILITGITTSLTWIYYYKSMKKTTLKNIVAIDKISTLFTMFFAFIFLKEQLNIVSFIFILFGILFMINNINKVALKNGLISVFFLSITAVLSKACIDNNNIISVAFIRTLVILLILTLISYKNIKPIKIKTSIYIFLSGLFTILSWLSFYEGIKLADVSLVMPLEKLNILFTILISREKMNIKEKIGLTFILIGTLNLFIVNM